MSNVLEFLERVGQDWQLRHADPAALAHAMSQAGIEPSVHQAILDQDSPRLAALLSLSGNICCAVHPAHEEEKEDEEDDDFDDEDDEDDEDDDEEDDEDEDDEDDEEEEEEDDDEDEKARALILR